MTTPPDDPTRRALLLQGLAAASTLSLSGCARASGPDAGAAPAASPDAAPADAAPLEAGPLGAAAIKATDITDSRPVVTFTINVQDFLDPDGSAQTLRKLCASFARRGVRGDFYLTAPMLRLYQQGKRADVIDALRGQGISYHVRPPHPLFHPFDSRLAGLDAKALRDFLRRFETQALDLSSAESIPGEPGGFAFVRDVFGRAPACVGLPNPSREVKQAAMDVYRNLGARGVVWYHGARAKLDSPYELRGGLLVRPADIVVDRWQAPGERRPQLWWNRYSKGTPGAEGRPEAELDARIAAWRGERPPFVQLPIHEDNFTRSGPDAWRDIYWADEGKSEAKPPPYNLGTRDVSVTRSRRETAEILDGYDALIAHCAARYRVMPFDGVVALAEAAGALESTHGPG